MTIPCDKSFLETMRRGTFQGIDLSGGFSYSLDLSAPGVAVAIHAGHAVPSDILPLMELSEEGRLYEEDPATDQMMGETPNRITVLESRAVYDINRARDRAIPLTPGHFWGIRVYKDLPGPEQNTRTLERYDRFYLFMGSLATFMLEKFGRCIVYAIHSYNLSRQVEKGIKDPPLFNLGTELLDKGRWGSEIASWLRLLGEIRLPGVRTTVEENRVFGGKGEFDRRMTSWDPRILVLPTEVAKVYMDEKSGALHRDRIEALRTGLQFAISSHLKNF